LSEALLNFEDVEDLTDWLRNLQRGEEVEGAEKAIALARRAFAEHNLYLQCPK
jgi:Xaa-Pro aminopeptidase